VDTDSDETLRKGILKGADMRSRLSTICVMTIIAVSCMSGIVYAQPQPGIAQCDGSLSIISTDDAAYLAIPVHRENASLLDGLRLYLDKGATILSAELVAVKDDGTPDLTLSQEISPEMNVTETGWLTVLPSEEVVAPPGRSWVLLKLRAESPDSEDTAPVVGYQLGGTATPALCGDGSGDWASLPEVQLAVQPQWATSVAGYAAKWNRIEDDAEEATTEAKPTLVGFRYLSPNPSSSGTYFHFSIAKEGPVTVNLYDVRGRRVRTIGPKTMTPGENTVFWDGTGNGGAKVANGVYFARFAAPGISTTQRVLVLR